MIYRHELKYLINRFDGETLKSKLRVLMDNDQNSDDGVYKVSSLYFDTLYNRFYDENAAGSDIRKKIRIRKYNDNNEFIKLEIKSKNNSLCYKESQKIDANIASRLSHMPYVNFVGYSKGTLGKVLLANSMYCLKPAIIVDYNRYALVHKTGNVRITFDYNITGDVYINNFLSDYRSGLNIIDDNHMILEVKYDDILPSYINDMLEDYKLNQIAYSKYYLCRNMMDI